MLFTWKSCEAQTIFKINYLIHTYSDTNITAISGVLTSTASQIKEVSGDCISLIGSDHSELRSS